jgi:hypothetical protein
MWLLRRAATKDNLVHSARREVYNHVIQPVHVQSLGIVTAGLE